MLLSRIGMDRLKHVFQLHGLNAAEAGFEQEDAPEGDDRFLYDLSVNRDRHRCVRRFPSLGTVADPFGHEVKMIAPQLAKPYVKRSKNDAAVAEALCEAMSRPTMRFVPIKSVDEQAALMLVAVRERLIRNRTQFANANRGYTIESGISAAKGLAHVSLLLEWIQVDGTVPELARELFASQAEEFAQLEERIADVDAKLKAWQHNDDRSKRLNTIPGIGSIGAALLIMKTPAPELFRSGRQFAAWIGLTRKITRLAASCTATRAHRRIGSIW